MSWVSSQQVLEHSSFKHHSHALAIYLNWHVCNCYCVIVTYVETFIRIPMITYSEKLTTR